MNCISILILIYFNIKNVQTAVKLNDSIDSNGYLIYCPCMGRFGNQAEQFLGTLQFSKSINRTLILPPFIEYVDYKVNFIPFEDLFDIDEIRQYHRVMTMKDFLSNLAPIVWPPKERTITCYSGRNFSKNKNKDKTINKNNNDDCNPFEGSPFKEFWHHFGIREFPSGSLFYRPLHTDYNYANEWKEKFGNVKVLAFVGAPSSFPTNGQAVKLSKHIQFIKNIMEKAHKYREERGFARKSYMAIHLRHGPDWIRACELIHSNPDLKQLFSSQQCLDGESSDKTLNKKITFDLCLPSFEQIIERIISSLDTYNSDNQLQPIQHLYIATDFNNESFWLQLNETINYRLKRKTVSSAITFITPTMTLFANGQFEHNDGDSSIKKWQMPHFITDLYLMAHANVFIGNCISSYSAFVSRYRIYRLGLHQITHFFSFPPNPILHSKDEL